MAIDIYADLLEQEEEERLKAADPYADILAKEDPLADMSAGELVVEGIKNVPKSVAGVVTDIATAVTSPVETAKGVASLAESLGNKLGRKAAELIHGKEMEVMPERSEEVADVAGQAIKDRYGSLEALKRTAVTDPAGLALDFSGAGGLVAKGAKAADPLAAIGRATQAGLGKTQAAERIYAGAAGIPKGMKPKDRLDIARTGLEEKIPVAPRGLDKIENIQSSLNKKLNEIIAPMDGVEDIVPTNVVIKHLDDLSKSREGKFEGNKDIAYIKKAKSDLMEEFGGNDYISTQQLHDFKTDINKKAYAREAEGTAKKVHGIKTDTMRQSGRGAKETLEDLYPDYADTNKRWGASARLSPMIEKRLNSLQDADPTLGNIARKTLGNAQARSKIAHGIDRIQKGDMSWVEKHLNSHEIRIALALAGRHEQMMDEYFE